MGKDKMTIIVPCYKISHIQKECKASLDAVDGKYQVIYSTGFSCSYNRNRYSNSNGDILYIDSDIAFKPEDIEALLATEGEIVSGNYQARNHPELSAAGYGRQLGIAYAGSNTLKVDWVGGGFLLVRASVWKKMQWPYFVEVYDKGKFYGEDIGFCENAKRAGIDIILNKAVKVKHLWL
jgi:GT2 family glycosyltransferase